MLSLNPSFKSKQTDFTTKKRHQLYKSDYTVDKLREIMSVPNKSVQIIPDYFSCSFRCLFCLSTVPAPLSAASTLHSLSLEFESITGA